MGQKEREGKDPKCLLRKFARNSSRVESQVSLESVLYGRYLSSSRWMDGRVTYCLMAFLRSFSKFNSVCSLSAAVVSAILARGRFYCCGGSGPLWG